MNRESKVKATAVLSSAHSGRLPAGWKGHPFLRGLSAEHLATLEECAMVTRFLTGQVIFREGEMANRFYLVFAGRVSVTVVGRDRVPVVIDEVGGGEMLGWSWLFPPYGAHFRAAAMEPTQAIFFYGTWLREQCEGNVALGYELTKRVAGVVMHRLEAMANRCFPADPGKS